MEKRKGLKIKKLKTFNKKNEIVGIIKFRKGFIIATKNAVYSYPRSKEVEIWQK